MILRNIKNKTLFLNVSEDNHNNLKSEYLNFKCVCYLNNDPFFLLQKIFIVNYKCDKL